MIYGPKGGELPFWARVSGEGGEGRRNTRTPCLAGTSAGSEGKCIMNWMILFFFFFLPILYFILFPLD